MADGTKKYMRIIHPETDLTRWRLSSVKGRHKWYYVPESEECVEEQRVLEAYNLGLDVSNFFPESPKCNTAEEAFMKAIKLFANLQAEDGHWPGCISGVISITPSLLFACYVAKISLPEEYRKEILRYIRSTQLPDGGWGAYITAPSTIFGTALCYIAMRILGLGPDHPDVVRARICLHKKGGALRIPLFGKIWLSILNVYSWDGLNALIPEIWLLPNWMPGHPTSYLCHTRYTLLAMTYCYSNRITAEEDELIQSLRQEIYVEDFYRINWPAQKNADLEAPPSWLQSTAYGLFNFYEKYHLTSIRKKALGELYEQVKCDDIYSNYINSGPVSKAFHLLICQHVEGSNSPVFQEHISRIYDGLWLGKNGMTRQVIGCQTWDATFAILSFLEADIQKNPEYESCLKKAYTYLKGSQVEDNPPNYERYYRQMSKGGFPFSYQDSGWIISDGTAEAIKTLILLEEKCPFIEERVAPQNFFDAVNVILKMRNYDGGFPPYETARGNYLLQLINAGWKYADSNLDFSFVECTSSVIQGLIYFQKKFPDHRADEISETLEKGLQYCRNKQRKDGSWYGSWGICFTYGTWLALEAFACMGYTYRGRIACQEVTKGCEFLVSIQMSDGGWGEEFESYRLRKYIQHTVSQTHQTAWALLGLMSVGYPDVRVLERGIKFLIDQQTSIGDWPEQDVNTGASVTGALDYTTYSSIFSIFALARFIRLYPSNSVARKLLDKKSELSEHSQNGKC